VKYTMGRGKLRFLANSLNKKNKNLAELENWHSAVRQLDNKRVLAENLSRVGYILFWLAVRSALCAAGCVLVVNGVRQFVENL